jgi:hypothetical protein
VKQKKGMPVSLFLNEYSLKDDKFIAFKYIWQEESENREW